MQKSLPAEADGAVHITPAAKTAAAPLTVAVNTLVFMLGFLLFDRPRHSAAAGCAKPNSKVFPKRTSQTAWGTDSLKALNSSGATKPRTAQSARLALKGVPGEWHVYAVDR